ncbi:MAG: hypothetical protein JWP76_1638 [Dactylosporangium sp.]|nr:hypothetical protein [Dactylosporangium sp.]
MPVDTGTPEHGRGNEALYLCNHVRVFEPGSRSKQTMTFMLPADVAAFSEAVAPSIAGFAQWETHERDAGIVLHDSLQVAMQHDGVQAFLRLLGLDGGTVGPIIQYLHTSIWTTDNDVLASTGGRYRPAEGRPEEMTPGRLAFKWFPDDEAECVRSDFAVLTGLAWKALQVVTSPHLETTSGKPARRYRIGRAAKAWALSTSERLVHDGALHLKVRKTR